MTFHFLFDLGPNLILLGGRFMAAFDEIKTKLDDLSVAVDAEKAQVLEAIAALEAELAGLTITPEQLAVLSGLIDGVKTQVGAIYEPPTPPPPPAE